MASRDIEPKVKQGAVAGALTGVVVWALISYVPAFHTGVPEPVVALIPVALAWAGHTVAAWRAPHDTRRDPAPVLPSATTGGTSTNITFTGPSGT